MGTINSPSMHCSLVMSEVYNLSAYCTRLLFKGKKALPFTLDSVSAAQHTQTKYFQKKKKTLVTCTCKNVSISLVASWLNHSLDPSMKELEHNSLASKTFLWD